MMARMMATTRGIYVAGALALAVLANAGAQEPRGGPGGPGGPSAGMGLVTQVTAADLPVASLAKALHLTSAQRSQIQTIQTSFRETGRAAMPPPGPDGAPPDRATMEAARAKMDATRTAAAGKLMALLTTAQKASLATVLKDANDFRAVQFPPDATTALNLTATQRSKIGTIATSARAAARTQLGKSRSRRPDFAALQKIGEQAHTKAVALLTATQKAALAKLIKNRRQGPGGPGGGEPGRAMPGGPGMGRPDSVRGMDGSGATNGRNAPDIRAANRARRASRAAGEGVGQAGAGDPAIGAGRDGSDEMGGPGGPEDDMGPGGPGGPGGPEDDGGPGGPGWPGGPPMPGGPGGGGGEPAP